MPTESPVLQSFVPGQLLSWLAERPAPKDDVASEDRDMVVWFADLSDFSRLTNEITELHKAGPEAVTELLNGTFGAIVDAVGRHGGEVLGFAGDSVMATWPIADGTGPAEALQLAGRCGLDVHELKLPDVYADQPPHRLRIGIGLGRAVLMRVGGLGGRWHFVIGGPPFEQIGRAVALAGPGEVVLSPEAWEAVRTRARGEHSEDGFLVLADVEQASPPAPATPFEVTIDLRDEIQAFLPAPVITHIEAGQSEWLAELRRVTSVFINLPTMDTSLPGSRRTLHDVVRATQRSLATYEGTLTRIFVDDKGITIMAAFGLPPFAHEEDPYLAVQASEEIQGTLTEMRLDYGIGIATGRAYCGAYGSRLRRDYTTVGREVNLAARLMQTARFEILCDSATARAARRVEFHTLEPRRLKGWDRPVEIFRPLWERVVPDFDRRASKAPRLHLLGREPERRQLTARLEALRTAGNSGVVMIEGDAGIGKTALAADLVSAAQSAGVETLVGAALPVAQAPYHAWRDIFNDVLGLTGIRSIERRQAIVHERLSNRPEFAQWEALLNPVLDLQFPETASTWGMSGTNRREATIELLTTVLGEAADRSPLLIVLDDSHWFDSASWALVLAVVQRVRPILMVLLTRPLLDEPEEMGRLADVKGYARLVLRPIDQRDAVELARERLDARDLAPDLARVIVDGAEGIPFFIEELIYSLRDANALVEHDGIVMLSRSVRELDVPHSLSSVVLSRIDRLAPHLQLTVKVASVVGRSFDVQTLAAAHPTRPPTSELETELSQLADLELIVESAPGSFDFKHSLIRDAAYDLLLFDQRRRIHRMLGAYIEARLDRREEPPYALLAYHWDRADDHQKALAYLEKTGTSSQRRGANREAIEAYTRALELLAAYPDEFVLVTPSRRSQWHVEMGQAHEALGKLDRAEASYYQALELLGVRVSTNPVRRFGRLLWETAKQMVHIFVPRAIRVPATEEEKVRLAQAARAASLIGQIYYFTGDLGGFPVLNLIAINLGEKAGDPIVAGLAYSSLGYLVGTMRLRRLAARYFRWARTAEEYELTGSSIPTPDVLDLNEMGPGHLIAVALAESVLALTFDEWDRARTIVTEGLERCHRLGDGYSVGISLAVRGFGSYSTGHLEDALSDFHTLLLSARERSNREHEGWATSCVIPVLLALGREADAETMAADATAILDEVDPLTVPIIYGTRSQVYLQNGQAGAALASAEAALAAFDSTPIFIYLAGFHGMLDTLLELWSREEPGSAAADHLAKLTKQGVKMIRSFALVLPFARPKYRLFKGRMEFLAGRTARAQRSLRRGLELAERSGFRWDEGLLHLELARTLPAGSSERQAHLARAGHHFEQIGSVFDLRRAAEL